MNNGQIIKKMRQNRKMTQEQVAEGLISRQAYSKIEKGDSEPGFELFQKLLERLNYGLSDFINEQRNYSKESQLYKAYLNALDGNLSNEEVQQTYNILKKNCTKNSHSLSLYGKFVGLVNKIYPLTVPNFSEKDKLIFREYIQNLNGFYSLNDLMVIADFAALSFDVKSLAKFYSTLPNFKTSDYEYDISSYQLQICKIYNNFADIFIFNDYLELGEECTDKLESFLTQRMNLRYSFYLKINRICLEYKKTNDVTKLAELLDIKKIMEQAGDIQTANSIEYQYKAYINKKEYNPDDALTPDK